MKPCADCGRALNRGGASSAKYTICLICRTARLFDGTRITTRGVVAVEVVPIEKRRAESRASYYRNGGYQGKKAQAFRRILRRG